MKNAMKGNLWGVALIPPPAYRILNKSAFSATLHTTKITYNPT